MQQSSSTVVPNDLRDLDLNALATFVHVAEARSFTAAATHLRIPKSTVSRTVARLEDILGVRLLQRTTRALTLTQEGEDLLQRAAPHLSSLRAVAADVSAVRRDPTGTLRVTMPYDFGVLFATDLVVKFSQMHPRVLVDVHLASRVVDLVAEGFDLAIRGGPLRDSTLVVRRISEGTMGLFASPQYLAKHGLPTTPDDLESHTFILFRAKDASTTLQLHNANTVRTVRVRGRINTDDLSFIRNCTTAGGGISLIPEFICVDDVAAGRLVRVLPDWEFPSGHLSIVYPSKANLPSKVVAFRDFLLEELKRRLPSQRG